MKTKEVRNTYGWLINIIKYIFFTSFVILVLTIFRNNFYEIDINFNDFWIEKITEFIIVCSILILCFIYLFPKGIIGINTSISASWKDYNQIAFVTINLGILINYWFVNGPITFFTNKLLSDLFDGFMVVSSINIILVIFKYLCMKKSKISTEAQKKIDPDQAIISIEEDKFNRKEFAEKIANMLKGISSKSLTIGIFGEWGSGKSSFYNMVKLYCQKEIDPKLQKMSFVDFKPWYFSTANDDLVRRFLLDLIQEIKSEEGHDSQLIKELKNYMNILSSLSIRSFGTVISLKEIFNQIIPNDKNKDLEEIKINIGKLLENSNRKIIVYIDDVDRLDGEEIKSIFKLVRLVADFPNIIYIIALDEEIVISALSTIYSKSSNNQEEARKYIEKFIQVPIYLPKVDEYYISKFYEEKLNEVFKEISGTPEKLYVEYNPQFINDAVSVNLSIRNIIRFINLVSVYYPILQDEVNSLDLLRLLIIKIDSPALFNYIHTNQSIFIGDKTLSEVEIEKLQAFSKYQVILSFLFPGIRKHFNLKEDNTFKYDSQKRIHDKNYFQQYFMYSVPDNILSHKSLIEFFKLLKLNNNEQIQKELKNLYLKYKRGVVIEKIQNYHYDLTSEQKIILIKNLGGRLLIRDISIKDKIYKSILVLVKSLIKEIVEENYEIDFRFYDLDPIFALYLNSFLEKNYSNHLKIEIIEFYKSLTLDVLNKENESSKIDFILKIWKKFQTEQEIKLKVLEWGKDYKTLDKFFSLTLDSKNYENNFYLLPWFIEIEKFLDDTTMQKLFSVDESIKSFNKAKTRNEKSGFSVLGYVIYIINNLTDIIIEFTFDIERLYVQGSNYNENEVDHSYYNENDIEQSMDLIIKYGTETNKEKVKQKRKAILKLQDIINENEESRINFYKEENSN